MSAVTSAAGGMNHGGFTAAETMVVPSAVPLPVPVSCSGSNSCARGGPVTGAPVSTMVDNIALPPSSKSVIDSTSNQTTFAQDTIVTAGHLSSKSTPQVRLIILKSVHNFRLTYFSLLLLADFQTNLS